MAEEDNRNESAVIVVPRLGLDIGTRHVRLRPSLEGVFGGDAHNGAGLSGIDLTAALAYMW